jgi:hypothetical protein
MINIKPIRDDWPNQRCKPYIIPFAGLINTPEGETMSNYTSTNFNYCSQNILKEVTSEAVTPITYITNALNSVVDSIKTEINSIRGMVDKVRTLFQSITEEIMGRIMNIMIPLQKIIISFRDLIGKIQGTMTAGLFTSLGTYYTLKSLLGAIAQFIIIILTALAALIAVFWLFPFTWGAAVANTSIFVALAIPMSLILAFMVDILKVHPDLSIPSVKCFDKYTSFTMMNGERKPAFEIQVGDVLKNNIIITAKIVVETHGSHMYDLNGIIVSDSHKVFYKDKVITVSSHPNAISLDNYTEPYLYCFNTNTKTIILNNTTFLDWDDLDNTLIDKLLYSTIYKLKHKYDDIITQITNDDIHKYLDYGFISETEITLFDKTKKKIKNICIGDILANGEKVYGIVEINKTADNNYYKTSFFPLTYYEKTLAKDGKLYHLLTDTKTFYINDIMVNDYNYCIDQYLI